MSYSTTHFGTQDPSARDFERRSVQRSFLALVLSLGLFGCVDSHTGDCEGAAPICYLQPSSAGSCCVESMTTPALCGASAWVCPSGYAEAEDCAPLAAACDGGPIADAGSEVDGGVDGGGSSIDYDGCDLPSDCALVPTTCCGVCGSPTIDDVAAIRGELSDAYYANVSCPESRDGPVPCPGCAGIPNPSLIAACTLSRGGTACSVVDLTEAPFTECGSNADCVLTTPQCCACGEIDAWQTIAVASSSLGRLNALLCDTDAPCPPCAPTFDPTLTPVCSSGRCEVIGPADP